MSEALDITDKWRIRYQLIQKFVDRILLEKEKLDCEHIRKTAKTGCCCRRCKAARSIHRDRMFYGYKQLPGITK